jgi:hypothetical protein
MNALTYTSVHRKLSVQLIAIVVPIVTCVLAMTQWLDIRLSERVLHHDIRERALLTLRTIHSLWDHAEIGDLRRDIETVKQGDREIAAIDIFDIDRGSATLVLTTRDQHDAGTAILTPDELDHVLHASIATAPLPASSSDAGWRLALPLVRNGAVLGAAQVEVSLSEITQLNDRLRWTAAVSVLASIVLTSSITSHAGRRHNAASASAAYPREPSRCCAATTGQATFASSPTSWNGAWRWHRER